MTVQELINELSDVEDKSLEVCFPYDFGIKETGGPCSVEDICIFSDCVMLLEYFTLCKKR